MNAYGLMAVIGGSIWVVMTVVYAMKYKEGIRARKWFGVIAYLGLAMLIGGLLEYYKELVEKVSPFWVFGGLVIFIYLTSKVYVFNNVEK